MDSKPLAIMVQNHWQNQRNHGFKPIGKSWFKTIGKTNAIMDSKPLANHSSRPLAKPMQLWITSVTQLKMYIYSSDLFRTVICDHMRAPEYYIASVQNRCSWKAYPCRDYSDFEKGKCRACNGECPSMGYDTDKTKRSGSFYLKTNSKAPFCGMWVSCVLLGRVVRRSISTKPDLTAAMTSHINSVSMQLPHA